MRPQSHSWFTALAVLIIVGIVAEARLLAQPPPIGTGGVSPWLNAVDVLHRADSVLWASRESGAQRAPAPTNTSHEHTANVLLEGCSSNTFEGAVGRSVSPAPAWRRGPPTAKHRT